MKKGIFKYISHIRRKLATLLFLVVSIIYLSYPLDAQYLTRRVNLAYLVKRSDIIVKGRIVEIKHESLPGYPNTPTIKVTLSVDEMMRGPQGNTYTFREILLDLRSKNAKKDYLVGQKTLLFLPALSRKGLSSPIGIEQGRFHIVMDESGNEMVVNGIGNAGLFKSVAQAASSEGYRLTKSQLRLVSAERGLVKLDEFSSLVKGLMSLRRIRESSR